MPPVVSVSGVSVREGRASLLHSVSLEIADREFVGVLGPNGSGKSTMLGLLNATRRPTCGNVGILGENVWEQHPEKERARLRARIGTVPQHCEFNAAVPIVVRDVVAMGTLGLSVLCGTPAREEQDRVGGAMERLGIAHLRNRMYRSLSGGEQQKVQFARVMAQQPELLLMDEPSTGLDLDWQERLVELIEELGRELCLPIVMTTHTVWHLPACCRRIVLLRGGQVQFDGPAEQALSCERLSALYGCPVDVVEHEGRRHCVARKKVAI